MTAREDRSAARAAFGSSYFEPDTKTALNAALDAMSKWRDEMATSTERNSSMVFDKMAAASKAAGWPDGMVDATRSSMQQMSKMQMQMMDQVMDAWTEQMKNPGKFTFGQSFQKQAPGPFSQGFPTGAFPGPFGQGFPGMPQMDLSKFGFGTNPMAPFQFWMEAGQMWQKMWADAMAAWMNNLPGHGDRFGGGR